MKPTFSFTKPKPRTDAFKLLAEKMPNAVHYLGKDSSEWAIEAGLDYEILESPVAYTTDGKKGLLFQQKKVFYRSDTLAPLSVVGKRFKVVQPQEIMEFYGYIAKRYGFKIAVAGEYNGGAKIWAMAETPHEFELIAGDKVKGNLFVITACDGSMSTQGFFSSLRLWCLNQLPVISRLASRSKGYQIFKCTHGSKFSSQRVERDLERMEQGWLGFKKGAEVLSNTKVSEKSAASFLSRHFHDGAIYTPQEILELSDNTTLKRLFTTYRRGEGQKDLVGTGWGVVNAVTRYLDHETRSKDQPTIVRKAWVEGARIKTKIYQEALGEFAPAYAKTLEEPLE